MSKLPKLQVKGYKRTKVNLRRADTVRAAVAAMNPHADDMEAGISDCIANCLHLAAVEGLEPFELHRRGERYFKQELKGEDFH